jgi:hypothetical protein
MPWPPALPLEVLKVNVQVTIECPRTRIEKKEGETVRCFQSFHKCIWHISSWSVIEDIQQDTGDPCFLGVGVGTCALVSGAGEQEGTN